MKGGIVHREQFVGDGLTTVFTLAVRVNPDDFTSVLVFTAGLLQFLGVAITDGGVDVGTVLTFAAPPPLSVIVDVVVFG